MNLIIIREKENLRKKLLANQKNSILRYLKPLSDASTQEIATYFEDRSHPDYNSQLEDSQPQDNLDNLHVPEDDPD